MIQIDVQTANRLEKGSHLRTPGNPAPPSGKQKCFKWIDSNKNRGLTDVSPKLGIPCACGLVRRESPVNGNCSGPEVRLWEVIPIRLQFWRLPGYPESSRYLINPVLGTWYSNPAGKLNKTPQRHGIGLRQCLM